MQFKLTGFASRQGGHKAVGEVTLRRCTGLWLKMMRSRVSTVVYDKGNTYSYKGNNLVILCDTLLEGCQKRKGKVENLEPVLA